MDPVVLVCAVTACNVIGDLARIGFSYCFFVTFFSHAASIARLACHNPEVGPVICCCAVTACSVIGDLASTGFSYCFFVTLILLAGDRHATGFSIRFGRAGNLLLRRHRLQRHWGFGQYRLFVALFGHFRLQSAISINWKGPIWRFVRGRFQCANVRRSSMQSPLSPANSPRILSKPAWHRASSS